MNSERSFGLFLLMTVDFTGAVQMISKVSKEMDLQLSENAISLIVVEPVNKGGLQMKISIERVTL